MRRQETVKMNISKTLIKKLTLGLTGLLISTTVSTTAMAAGNIANGKKLFTNSKCNQCHGTEVFTRKDRKVTDLAKLEAQVRRCDSNLNTNWFDDEIIDVTAHLNKQYYKF
jgi:mono/diheme cytochrome c family protein